MYLDDVEGKLRARFAEALFRVEDACVYTGNAKEYLHRLERMGRVERVAWGWYRMPQKFRDVWSFLRKDPREKVVIAQTAASIWNYDFIHRDLYRLAVEDPSYARALREFGEKMGWKFEVEERPNLRTEIEYRRVDGLDVEAPESVVVTCMSGWAFADALAVLHFRREDIAMGKLKQLARWTRIANTDVRVWNAVKYACNELNSKFRAESFNVRKTRLNNEPARRLIAEAVEKVAEFA